MLTQDQLIFSGARNMSENAKSTFHRLKMSSRAMAGAVLVAVSLTAPQLLAPQSYAQERLAEAAGPFGGLAGSWSGGGVIKTREGGQERIRCRGTYAVKSGG